jgi:hypothetical protein
VDAMLTQGTIHNSVIRNPLKVFFLGRTSFQMPIEAKKLNRVQVGMVDSKLTLHDCDLTKPGPKVE